MRGSSARELCSWVAGRRHGLTVVIIVAVMGIGVRRIVGAPAGCVAVGPRPASVPVSSGDGAEGTVRRVGLAIADSIDVGSWSEFFGAPELDGIGAPAFESVVGAYAARVIPANADLPELAPWRRGPLVFVGSPARHPAVVADRAGVEFTDADGLERALGRRFVDIGGPAVQEAVGPYAAGAGAMHTDLPEGSRRRGNRVVEVRAPTNHPFVVANGAEVMPA